jgi:two-component system, OmpR family, response regulator
MLPYTVALVDDDREYAEFLSTYLKNRGASVNAFADSTGLLVRPDAYEYDFYVLDLALPGMDGLDLIKVLRGRTDAGILVASGRLAPEVFTQSISSGADMYLAKPIRLEQVAVAIQAVQRRVSSTHPGTTPWKLDRRARQLVAPDGARVDLSEGDLAIMECFVTAKGQVVPRETLLASLKRSPSDPAPDSLNATIYRLRRRVERATPGMVPLQSKSRVGYVFRSPLAVI